MFAEGRHYIIEAETGCWRWQMFKLRGYARSSNGQAHRRLYEQIVGPIPAGYDLHHTCSHLDCVNPDHLVAVEHGRHLARHKRADSKLNATDVVSIRERAAALDRLDVLAEEYGVGREAIEDIVSGRNWRDIGGPTGRPETYCALPGCGRRLTGHRAQRYCSHAHRQAAYVLRTT